MSTARRYEWSMGAAGPVIAAMDSGEDTGWRDLALCAQVDGELFFPPIETPETAAPAQSVCAECLAWAECFTYALANPGLQGIWGGTTEAERRALRPPVPAAVPDDREKICTGPCGLPRPLSEFRLLTGRRERRRETWCEACRREAHRRVAA